jgi:hypothetical protein
MIMNELNSNSNSKNIKRTKEEEEEDDELKQKGIVNTIKNFKDDRVCCDVTLIAESEYNFSTT